jgi:hypothetical protein
MAAVFSIATATGQTADAGIKPALAAALSAKYAVLKDRLGHTSFGRPLQMESLEGKDTVSGEIHAVVDHPFATTGAALSTPSQWCDILILHLNTKYCRPSADPERQSCTLSSGPSSISRYSKGTRSTSRTESQPGRRITCR